METTWDGLPVSVEPPFGAAVVVYRRHPDRLLLLHRHHHGPDHAGDWAWTPPSGARMPGEAVDACALRELAEEAGVEGVALTPVRVGEGDPGGGADPPRWALFACELPEHVEVRLVDVEHDRFEWVPVGEALGRILPASVREDIAAVCRRIGLLA